MSSVGVRSIVPSPICSAMSCATKLRTRGGAGLSPRRACRALKIQKQPAPRSILDMPRANLSRFAELRPPPCTSALWTSSACEFVVSAGPRVCQ